MRKIKSREALLDESEIQQKFVAEIGVYQAGFSEEILKRNPAKLYLIDPWHTQPKDLYPDDYANLEPKQFEELYQKIKKKYENHKNVQIIRDFSIYAAQQIPNQSLDFVYIDAIHLMDSCLSDILTWFPKVKDGGWLTGHDYCSNFFGVQYAIKSFCKLTGQQLTAITTDEWPSWAIQIDYKLRPATVGG